MQTILQEIGAARVKVHSAFLVDQRLQEFQFGFGELRLYACCAHAFFSVTCSCCYFEAAAPRAFSAG